MTISICATFFGGRGHCNVNVIPSEFENFKITASSCAEYELSPGSYNVALVGISPPGGIIVEAKDGNTVIATKTIKKEGNFSRFMPITI